MPDSHNQKSFHSGEWAPWVYARVDLAKYHAGAALLRNFFVDYRGGASNRAGTEYVLQALKSDHPVRLIPFTASFTTSYVLEFGDFYVRFYSDGSAVLEDPTTITGATQANPCALHIVAHGYLVGDWVFIEDVGGMTQLNGRYFIVGTVPDVDHITLTDLNGVDIDSTAYGAYTAGGTARRVYTISSPYAAADLALLKFAQNVNTLTICHPSYAPAVLTLVSATNWTLVSITFGPTIAAPVISAVTTTLAGGNVFYSYEVTSVDINGQESAPSTAGVLSSKQDITTTAGSNVVSWPAVSGAQYYNVYESVRAYSNAVPSGAQHGFLGFTYGVSFVDTNIVADFSSTPPIVRNPFQGAGVDSITITINGRYVAVPSVTIDAAPGGGFTATAQAVLGVQTITAINAAGAGYTVGDALTFAGAAVLIVATVNGGGGVTGFQSLGATGSYRGAVTGTGNVTPANPNAATGGTGAGCTVSFTWGVTSAPITQPGAGYLVTPAVAFSAGVVTATGDAVLGTASAGNPSVPAFFQQRLTLMGPSGSPQQFNMSQPGSYYNFNVSNPVQSDDAIQGTLISSVLNSIKSAVAMPGGLVVLGDRQAWQISGGGQSAPITPVDATATPQAFAGANDMPPILCNYDLLYVQAKGSSVRDLSYNFYTNIYTGTDISILSSHLFFGFEVLEWAYAEEPFKLIWVIRDDGTLLSLTFLKEQEVIGWAHHDTNGSFKSICTVTEQTTRGAVDAIYVVVEREVNGNTVQYIERMADRFVLSNTVPGNECWFVDSGIEYSGAPVASFTGAEHLAGMEVTGLADGVVITPFTMPTSGFFTLSAPISNMVLGLAYTAQLQTLILDLGEPSVIGKLKKIVAVTIRAAYTLGIKFGRTLTSLVAVKDFSGTMDSQGVTQNGILITRDGRQPIDPLWDQDGQYYIVQDQPLPCTILGVVPEIKNEDRR
jgi:hypothetical protein